MARMGFTNGLKFSQVPTELLSDEETLRIMKLYVKLPLAFCGTASLSVLRFGK
jgi:hypothetical protein